MTPKEFADWMEELEGDLPPGDMNMEALEIICRKILETVLGPIK